GLFAGAGHRPLAAGDGAAAGIATGLYRESNRRDRDAATQAAGGDERVRRRRARPARTSGGAPRIPDHQLYAQARPQHYAARPRTFDRAGTRKRSRYPLLVPRREWPARGIARGD